MSKRILPYNEGDWCSIPLGSGGFALALIARSNGKGHLFCYFFGPRRTNTPRVEDTAALKPGDAVLHALCHDLGLIRKNWRFVGRPAVWDRFDWPIPLLAERDSASGALKAVQFEDTLSTLTRKLVKLPKPELDQLQGAGLVGPSAIEGFLDKNLARPNTSRPFPVA